MFHRWLQTQTSLTEAFSQQQKGEVGTHTHTHAGLSQGESLILPLLLHLQVVISEAALEQVLTTHFPGKPAEAVRALLSCAVTQQQQPPSQPGTVDFIKLMSPVRKILRIVAFHICALGQHSASLTPSFTLFPTHPHSLFSLGCRRTAQSICVATAGTEQTRITRVCARTEERTGNQDVRPLSAW